MTWKGRHRDQLKYSHSAPIFGSIKPLVLAIDPIRRPPESNTQPCGDFRNSLLLRFTPFTTALLPTTMPVMDEKKDDSWAAEEYIEDVSSKDHDNASILAGIEETATSKAAWLITLTVSLGGFLFGILHSPQRSI